MPVLILFMESLSVSSLVTLLWLNLDRGLYTHFHLPLTT